MTLPVPTLRRFTPGTTGWTEDDLDDPGIERLWHRGGYEIIEGVLTKMPAAYLDGSLPLRRLVRQVERQLEQRSIAGEFAFEVDLVINQIRIPVVDAVFLTQAQMEQQGAIQGARKSRRSLRYGRLRVAPELIIESISPGHELHDRQTKREWYREFGVSNYWLFDAYRRTLECLHLKDGVYRTDVAGKDQDEISPVMFGGISLVLSKVWM
ncbi:MAG TPA: Uma2 family endonuclease [Tepidisphaeraceae bacterium]|nr:Uma2 family endonuclease [Tepidisphaeraceae bacterium]